MEPVAGGTEPHSNPVIIGEQRIRFLRYVAVTPVHLSLRIRCQRSSLVSTSEGNDSVLLRNHGSVFSGYPLCSAIAFGMLRYVNRGTCGLRVTSGRSGYLELNHAGDGDAYSPLGRDIHVQNIRRFCSLFMSQRSCSLSRGCKRFSMQLGENPSHFHCG